jgi:CRISPR system Cascade subunit CasE
MSDLFLSRAHLRHDVPAAALWRQIAPSDDAQRMVASHRLVWTLFSDGPTRQRDFLWREATPGTFYFLSRRAPEDRHNLFDLDTPKRFAPALSEGDRLKFSLRANATIARRSGDGAAARRRGIPSDVVMDALFRIPKGRERATARSGIVEAAGAAWLAGRGEKCGFQVTSSSSAAGPSSVVTSYRVMRLDSGTERIRIGVLEFEGLLTVIDPEKFIAALGHGFGRAKAFGCGLMMIRRA